MDNDTLWRSSVQYALKKVYEGRLKQDTKWGNLLDRTDVHSVDRWLTILTEELGEVARAMLEYNQEEFLKELIDLAAVAVAMYEIYSGYGQSLRTGQDIDSAALKI